MEPGLYQDPVSRYSTGLPARAGNGRLIWQGLLNLGGQVTSEREREVERESDKLVHRAESSLSLPHSLSLSLSLSLSVLYDRIWEPR